MDYYDSREADGSRPFLYLTAAEMDAYVAEATRLALAEVEQIRPELSGHGQG